MTRLLLVNDDRLFLELEQSFLRRANCEVITASTADEAIEKTRSHRPDLVLLDVAIPRMDGQEVCRILKADEELSGIPVLLLITGRDEKGAFEAGADGTIPKPITRAKVLAAIRRHLPIPDRSAERRAVRLPVTCREEREEYRAHTRDLSFTGMFLACPQPPPVGRHVTLDFRLPRLTGRPSRVPICIEAEVVRSVTPAADSHRLPGMGVRFLGLGAADKAAINRFVREPLQRVRSGEL
jgi:uncharacterized protein (TIGR02266 family)